jgi:hypothetical protein
MFCGRCGNELKEDSKFCNKCGWKVETADNGVQTVNAVRVVNNSEGVMGLDKRGLIDFLNKAKPEAERVEEFVQRIEEMREEIETLEKAISKPRQKPNKNMTLEKSIKSQKNAAICLLVIVGILVIFSIIVAAAVDMVGGLAFLAFSLFFGLMCLPLIYIVRKNKKYVEAKAITETKLAILRADAENYAKTIFYLNQLPRDYRNLLAIETMLKILENGIAGDWSQLAKAWEEQKHNWTVERTTEEALEYSKLSALYAESAAANAARASSRAGVAAVFSILNFFWR